MNWGGEGAAEAECMDLPSSKQGVTR